MAAAIHEAVSSSPGGQNLSQDDIDQVVAVFDSLWPTVDLRSTASVSLVGRIEEIAAEAMTRCAAPVEGLGGEFVSSSSLFELETDYGLVLDPAGFAGQVADCWQEAIKNAGMSPGAPLGGFAAELNAVIGHEKSDRIETKVDALHDRLTRVTATSPTVSWPVQVGVPPRLAASFQSRGELAREVSAGLSPDGSAVLGQVVASGMGGVGKTQLAASVFNGTPVDLRVWVTASSRDGIVTGYGDAARAVGAAPDGDVSVDEAAVRFLSWLAVTDRSWLVVLDDVTDEADLVRLVPSGANGAVLVTTRLRNLRVGPGRHMNVDVFTPAESVAYLSESLTGGPFHGLPDDVLLLEVGDLVEDLGCLPLALSHAAAVISYDGISCARYRRRFADRRVALAEIVPDRPPDDYSHTIATTWALAIDRADDRRPARFARPVLNLLSVLDSNGVPDIIWDAPAARQWITEQAEGRPAGASCPPETAATVRRAVRNLHQLNLVAHDPNAGSSSVRTHAMVQRAVAAALNQDQLDAVVQAAADALYESWPDSASDQMLAEALRASAAALGRHPTNILWADRCHPVLIRVGRSLSDTGNVTQALSYFTDLARTAAEELEADHRDMLTIRANIAIIRREIGDLSGALVAYSELLADSIRLLGADHADTMIARSNLAYVHADAGDLAGAIEALKELLIDQFEVLGADHLDVLRTRANIAHLTGERGDLAGAVEALEELLVDQLQVLGPDDNLCLTTRHNIAYWKGKSGDITGAVAAFDELLTDELRVLGPDHPRTLDARAAMAHLRGKTGDPAEAAVAFEELLDDRLRVLGPGHPNVLRTRAHVAYLKAEAGDLPAAVEAFEKLLIDQRQVLGPDHPDTLSVRFNLADLRGRAGDAATAAVAFEELLRDRLRVLGPEHPDTLNTRAALLVSQIKAGGDPDDTVQAAKELVVDRLRILGPDHPDNRLST